MNFGRLGPWEVPRLVWGCGLHNLMQDAEPPKDQVCQNSLKYHKLFSCYQILPPLSQFCQRPSHISKTDTGLLGDNEQYHMPSLIL